MQILVPRELDLAYRRGCPSIHRCGTVGHAWHHYELLLLVLWRCASSPVTRFEIHQAQLPILELPLGQGYLLHLHRHSLPLQYPELDSLVHELSVLLLAHNPIPRPYDHGSPIGQRALRAGWVSNEWRDSSGRAQVKFFEVLLWQSEKEEGLSKGCLLRRQRDILGCEESCR